MKNLDSIIAGPCAAESEEQVLQTATLLYNMGIKHFRAGVWKPRTKPGCFEGHGEKALRWLQKVQQMGMTVATEVATPEHVRLALQYGIDRLWIGTRTVANPFDVQNIADTLKAEHASATTIMVKNPMTPDIDLWIGAIQRLYDCGQEHVIAIHRGFFSYAKTQYRNQPMWQIPLELYRQMPNITIYCDPSHIAGKRELVENLSREALNMGFDGLMIESHCQPSEALSDSRQQLAPAELEKILSTLIVKDRTNISGLEFLRKQIDELDDELLNILAKRMSLSREIGQYKKEHNIQIFQGNRYNDILQKMLSQAEKSGISKECIKSIFEFIHEESVRQQL